MNTQQFKNNGHSKFPISTDTLDFMQEQIKFLQELTRAVGQNVIIQQPTASKDGLVIFNGELLPLQGDPDESYIEVISTSEDITALGETYQGARIRRHASYTGTLKGNAKDVYDFNDFGGKSLADVRKYLTKLRYHAVPKGTIVMWSGSINAIPTGWSLCDGQVGTPDLRGRFIVGYEEESDDYGTIGNTGGAEKVLLTANQSGLPAHSHGITIKESGAHTHGIATGTATTSTAVGAQKANNEYGGFNTASAGTHTHSATINPVAAQQARSPHENRPPYYVLAYIIKTTDVPTL